MTKKIYRTWRDELPLWSLYAAIAASGGVVLFLLVPHLWGFLKKLDWRFFAKERYLYLRWIFQGLVMTLRLSAISMVFALLLGTLVAVGRLSPSRLLRGICIPYIEFFRNTPLLVQLFFWYFGTSTLLEAIASLLAHLPWAGPFLGGWTESLKVAFNKGQSEFYSGVIGLTVYTSAFIAETVRAGIQAIPHGQTEAARSTGLNGFQTLWFVILPQAFRIIIPPLLSQFLALTKNSSQAMAIGVAEATYMARQVEANTFKGFEAFTVATGLYMIISFLLSWALNRYNSAISITEMARKRQRLLASRRVPGYRLGRGFILLAAVAGLLVFTRGGRLAASGSWGAGIALYLVGFVGVAAALVAGRRPDGGIAFLKGALLLGGTAVFFDVLGQLDRGLAAFDDPFRQVWLPLGWAALYCLTALFWWLYFSRREALFLRGDGT